MTGKLKRGHRVCKSEKVLMSGVKFYDRDTGQWYQITETDKMIDGKRNVVFANVYRFQPCNVFPVSLGWFRSLLQRDTYTIMSTEEA